MSTLPNKNLKTFVVDVFRWNLRGGIGFQLFRILLLAGIGFGIYVVGGHVVFGQQNITSHCPGQWCCLLGKSSPYANLEVVYREPVFSFGHGYFLFARLRIFCLWLFNASGGGSRLRAC